MENLKFNAWYSWGYGKDNKELLGKFDTLKEAQEIIQNNEHYKKSLFTKKGDPTSRNENEKESFKIYDNQGYGWSIRDR